MRRAPRSRSARLLGLLLVLTVLVLGPTAAFATEAGGGGTETGTTETTEGGAEGGGAVEGEGHEAPGAEPRGANDPENAFAPEGYQINFLWGAAVGLAVLSVGGAAVLGLLYYLQVVRPSQEA